LYKKGDEKNWEFNLDDIIEIRKILEERKNNNKKEGDDIK